MSEHRIDHGGAELSAGPAANNKPSRREALHLGLQATLAGCFAGSMRSVGLSAQIEDGELARGEIARVELEDSKVESGTFEDLEIIDCHTHLVYGGTRSQEFAMRLHCASYEDVARAGGGIVSTVRSTRQAGADELLTQALQRLERRAARRARRVAHIIDLLHQLAEHDAREPTPTGWQDRVLAAAHAQETP